MAWMQYKFSLNQSRLILHFCDNNVCWNADLNSVRIIEVNDQTHSGQLKLYFSTGTAYAALY